MILFFANNFLLSSSIYHNARYKWVFAALFSGYMHSH